MNTEQKILLIGVTGGIGAGKTKACSLFNQLGYPILSADLIAQDIMQSDPQTIKNVKKIIGVNAYSADNRLDRAFVAEKVFSNRHLLMKLNGVVHPKVHKEIFKRCGELAAKGEKAVIVEAALLFESGFYKELDIVVVIAANDQNRIDRIMQRDSTDDGSVRRRMESQLDQKAKIGKADYVIHNDGTVEELEARVKFLAAIFSYMMQAC